jgi:hypothetical protein
MQRIVYRQSVKKLSIKNGQKLKLSIFYGQFGRSGHFGRNWSFSYAADYFGYFIK